MKRLFIAHVLLIILLIAGGSYLGEYIQQADLRRAEEKLQRLVTDGKYNAFPEVVAVREHRGLLPGQKPPTQRDIQVEITRQLKGLEVEYTSKLDQLIRQAKKEYAEAKASKYQGIPDGFIGKYLKRLKALEEECDVRVYALLLRSEAELNRYGYDLAPVEQAREYYKESKKQRRQQLFDKY